jgi:hypothetical protein
MRYRGLPSWPPLWSDGRKQGGKTFRGEVGILRAVHFSNKSRTKKLFLVIEHETEHFVGTLVFDDPAFCRRIADLLHTQIGRSIKVIGDLDVSFES